MGTDNYEVTMFIRSHGCKFSNKLHVLKRVFIRSGCLEFSDTSNDACISACEINAFIQFLCTS